MVTKEPETGTEFANRNGTVSQAELTQVLKKISPQMTDVEIAAVMKAADLDKDGRISYAEFVDWVFSGQPESEEHKEAQKNAATALQYCDGGGDYPPTGLSANVRKLPAWIQMGCGDTPYICAEKKATFPGDKCPDTMPDFTGYGNFMADELTANPALYTKLKDLKTKSGVGLAACMKTGVDNPGHPHIKTVGLVAGDEETYEVFKELFDPVIDKRHGGYGPDAKHPTNLDIDKISDIDIDPTGKYVLMTRVRTGRSVRPFQLPPVISFDDRRKLEAAVVKALLKMEGDLKGDYFPLHGSKSYAPKPDGMPEYKEEDLRKTGNLFQEPDSTLLLASGMGRHWPDGRGIFHNDKKNLSVWLNEEDHMRIVSMQGSRSAPSAEGKNIKEVFARFITACNEVQKVLKEDGYDFMHNDHLGWVFDLPLEPWHEAAA